MGEQNFPAKFTMHAPNGATNACVEHARQIDGLFVRMWGMRIQATAAPEGAQCDNCVNTAKAAAEIGRNTAQDWGGV